MSRVGHLVPAGGERALPLDIRELVKAAQDRAHRDVSLQLVERLAKRAAAAAQPVRGPQMAQEAPEDPEVRSSVQGVLAPAEPLSRSQEPQKGLGRDWAPVAADGIQQLGLSKEAALRFIEHWDSLSELEKQAFLRKGYQAVKGFLGRLRSPIKTTQIEGAGKVRSLQSPLKKKPTGTYEEFAPVTHAGPMRTAAPPTGAPPPTPKPAAQPPPIPKDAGDIPDLTRHAKVVKPKSLTSGLIGPAALLGTGALAYYGIPRAVRFAEQASASPAAYNFGMRQYQFGYGPGGQAQF